MDKFEFNTDFDKAMNYIEKLSLENKKILQFTENSIKFTIVNVTNFNNRSIKQISIQKKDEDNQSSTDSEASDNYNSVISNNQIRSKKSDSISEGNESEQYEYEDIHNNEINMPNIEIKSSQKSNKRKGNDDIDKLRAKILK